jgi:hypothetical protein
MNFYKSKVTKNFIFFLFILLINSCKNEVVDVMPYVQVQVTVTSGELATLGVGEAMLKNGGYAGLIIYQKQQGVYVAFERLCTNYPNDTSAVVLDKSTQIATCPKCKSSFLLPADGDKSNEGPARLPLRQYQCISSGNRLTIVN